MATTTHDRAAILVRDVTSSASDVHYLFGGESSWDESSWTATDDRVRGGSSISHLTVHSSSSGTPAFARFSGNLDTSTLGGAGFASQRTKGELDLDLSDAIGVRVRVLKTDGKRYLLTLKDDIPGRRGDGREMSGVTWEAEVDAAECEAQGKSQDVFLPWTAFKATYRGRPKDDAEPLKLESIKRVSFMMRSFFGKQEGDFSLDVESIAAILSKDSSTRAAAAALGPESVAAGRENHDVDDDDDDHSQLAQEKAAGAMTRQPPRSRGWWRRMLCGLV